MIAMSNRISVSEWGRFHWNSNLDRSWRFRITMNRVVAFVACVASVLLGAVSLSAEEVYSYTAKGVVKALPGNGRASNEIIVKHEPIPNYRDEAGNVVGMMAMTMPFYLAEATKIEGINVGDSIELIVEQRLKPKFSEQVVAVKKLNVPH
jgi:Cu/Ag efflux protein CusF